MGKNKVDGNIDYSIEETKELLSQTRKFLDQSKGIDNPDSSGISSANLGAGTSSEPPEQPATELDRYLEETDKILKEARTYLRSPAKEEKPVETDKILEQTRALSAQAKTGSQPKTSSPKTVLVKAAEDKRTEAAQKSQFSNALKDELPKKKINDALEIENYYKSTKMDTEDKDSFKQIEARSKEELYESFKIFSDKISKAKEEIEKVIKGQEQLVISVLRGFICHGNILLESLPGLGKTVLCRCLAKICEIDYNRVQFTTDLLPSDIIGFVSYDKERGFEIQKGPLFTNLLLADEINRAPPKVQSALLEAMGERQVTLGKETHKLDDPFLVLATQNPLEQSGTFPLPEAQIDRFMFKIIINYPDYDSEYVIMEQNLSSKKLDEFNLKKILSSEDILIMQSLNHYVHVEPKLRQYILNIVRATRDPHEAGIEHASLVQMGGSPRASIALLIASKAQALMQGRHYIIPQDIRDVVYEVLRHRIYLNFQAKMENISTDDIIKEIIDSIKIY